ncbi:MAG: TolC family protein [Acidobacterium ailaaui]|nr:TolC family protein [Pseudacidobacterium ailaaui]MCL6463410.1 TolC family protein [Pseudacidobacterium ailaaui]
MALCLWLLVSFRMQAQVSLYTVVDLALRNSAQVRMAQADVMRAAAGLTEAKDAYIPNLMLGSSLGYSYGFPLGEPSVFNVTSQSLLFTFSQPDYVRSARAALRAAELNLKDSRQQVILDTALDYAQLDKTQNEMAALDQEKQYADKLVSIEQDRVLAGVDGRTELTRAELTAAQITLKRIHLENEAESLRQQLAHLTGLAPSSFITDSRSIPAAPDFLQATDLGRRAGMLNAGIQAAEANAKSKMYVAFGDSRQTFRPQLSFGADYSLFAKFNNYDQYFRSFQYNNFNVGIQIRVPLFDASLKSRQQRSAAEAAHAAAEADQTRNQVNEQILQMQRSLAELRAQQRVAQLQAELAQEQLEALTTQLEQGSGSPGAPLLTPKDEQQARILERQRYEEMLDADFAVVRVELNLMRSIGTIEDWAKSGPQK